MTTTEIKHRVDNIEDIVPYLTERIHALLESPSELQNIERIEIEIPQTDIIQWYAQQTFTSKLFWSDRVDCFQVAGIESAEIIKNGSDSKHTKLFSRIKERVNSTDSNIRYFGGIKFDVSTEISKEWKKFGSSCFTLPRFELSRMDDNYQFAINFIFPDDLKNKDKILFLLGLPFEI